MKRRTLFRGGLIMAALPVLAACNQVDDDDDDDSSKRKKKKTKR